MVVGTIHVGKEVPPVFAQGLVEDERARGRRRREGGLVQHEAEPAAIDLVFPPRGLPEDAGEMGCVGALEKAAGDMG